MECEQRLLARSGPALRRSALLAVALVTCPALVACPALVTRPALAQQGAGGGGATPPAPADNRTRLKDLQTTIDASDARRRALAADMATYATDRARFQSSLLATTDRTSAAEARAAAVETRLAALEKQEAATRASLQGRRALLSDILAALQRMGRKPPPALLVDPADVLKAIRTSMLLGAVLPGMRAAVDALAADLETLKRTRAGIEAERATLDHDLADLAGERARLQELIDARQAALGRAEGDIAAERDKARRLAEEAGSLKELIGRTDNGTAAREAHQSDEKLAAAPGGPVPAPFKDAGRLAPAVAFASTRGALPLPVSGTVLRRFGEDDGLGSSEKGMLFATRPSAVVASPADGWIAFAGPYRSFGQLLILNVGGGYYIVLAGMDRVNVSSGQFVLAGEPVASMGEGPTRTAAAVALGAAQPVLYVEFRKDGATIDPGPWWAKPEIQKVRG